MLLARKKKKKDLPLFLGGSKAEGMEARIVMGFKKQVLFLLWHRNTRKVFYDFKDRIEA